MAALSVQTRQKVLGCRQSTQEVWTAGEDTARSCERGRSRSYPGYLQYDGGVVEEVGQSQSWTLSLYPVLLTAVDSISDYYDAFVSIQRGLFNTRDRAEHTRKRKTVSHTFSMKSIGQFEQYMAYNLQQLVNQWDRISDTATDAGQTYAHLDSLHWFNYLAFDIIGDLVSGPSFDMML